MMNRLMMMERARSRCVESRAIEECLSERVLNELKARVVGNDACDQPKPLLSELELTCTQDKIGLTICTKPLDDVAHMTGAKA
jgi:hypothetical protein